MYKMKLIDAILADKPQYVPPFSSELAGEQRTLGSAGPVAALDCIKCEEDAYLLLLKDGCAFFDRAAGLLWKVGADDPVPAGSDLAGWTAELAVAPGTTLCCTFGAEDLCCEGETVPAVCRKLREKLYLVSAETEDGTLILVVDTARFLIYGAACGYPFGGYIRNIKQDR